MELKPSADFGARDFDGKGGREQVFRDSHV
jgi:hypothetical protein